MTEQEFAALRIGNVMSPRPRMVAVVAVKTSEVRDSAVWRVTHARHGRGVLRRAILTMVLGAWLSGAAAQRPPAYLDPVNRSVWKSDELGVTFAYANVWKEAESTMPSTRIVVNWRTQRSQALLATCYLEASGPLESEVARLGLKGVERRAENIALGYEANMKKRAADGVLVTWRATQQDGYPVVYIEREGTITNFDGSKRLRLYSLVTSWREREVNLECGSVLTTNAARRGEAKAGQLADEIERGIKAVLGTLQFHR